MISVRTFSLVLLIMLSFTGGLKSQWKAEVLHSFNGTDGATSIGSLTLSGNTLYGRTSAGGTNGKGVIFKINTDSTGFQVLYNFESGSSNALGKEPHHDAMYLMDTVLYGTALFGGNNDNGVVFKINVNGTGYTPLHIFTGGNNDGAQPHSCLILVNNVFYGITAEGGTHNHGTIYKINPDGTGFAVLYSFHSSTGDDSHGRLTLSSGGNKLFGMTKSGGSGTLGVIFSYDISSTNYDVLHNFTGSATDGSTTDHGYLTRSGDTIFGMTQLGGANNEGVLFSMKEDGSNFQLLHSFGTGTDGSFPYGSLALSNGFLYGTTREGGTNDNGTVFRISTSGADYETLHSLNRAVTGEFPIDNVVLNPEGSHLYFFSQRGGVYDTSGTNSYGTINMLYDLKSIGIQTISSSIPDRFHLEQNYPNPFNPSTNIKFSLTDASHVSLKVYDISGKVAATLVNSFQNVGTYSVSFNAAGLPSGVYFYTLETDGFTSTKKMVLLK